MMSRSYYAVWLVIFLHAFISPSHLHSQTVSSTDAAYSYERTFPVGDHPTLILKNTSIEGNIEVQTWERSGIKIAAHIQAPNTKIDAQSSDGMLQVKLRREGVVSHEPVHFWVWVPAQCEVDLSTMSGKIIVWGVRNRLKAMTTEGDIELLDVSGSNVDASSSTSGKITLSTQLSGQGKYTLYSGIGQVTILFRDPASFVLNAATREGRIEADGFRLTDQSSSKHQLQGTYGTGEAMLIVRTDRGTISLKKR